MTVCLAAAFGILQLAALRSFHGLLRRIGLAAHIAMAGEVFLAVVVGRGSTAAAFTLVLAARRFLQLILGLRPVTRFAGRLFLVLACHRYLLHTRPPRAAIKGNGRLQASLHGAGNSTFAPRKCHAGSAIPWRR